MNSVSPAWKPIHKPAAAGVREPRVDQEIPTDRLELQPSENEMQDASSKKVVYLAGAWGFSDFDANRASYGDLTSSVDDVPQPKKGLAMLGKIEAELEAHGFDAQNPWTESQPSAFIAGVMFGEGPDLDGNPWSEGKLVDHSLSKDRLHHWLEKLSSDPRVTPGEYNLSPHQSYSQLESSYRHMVGDVVYRGNKAQMESADVVFANLNSYRGDADDGTLWEVLEAAHLGKQVMLLVDENAPASLGEGIFGKTNRWNMMVSGYVKEHPEQFSVFHTVEDAVKTIETKFGV